MDLSRPACNAMWQPVKAKLRAISFWQNILLAPFWCLFGSFQLSFGFISIFRCVPLFRFCVFQLSFRSDDLPVSKVRKAQSVAFSPQGELFCRSCREELQDWASSGGFFRSFRFHPNPGTLKTREGVGFPGGFPGLS